MASQKGILVMSLVLYILLGLALTPFLLPGAAAHLGYLTIGALLLGMGPLAFVMMQRQNPWASGIRLLENLHLCPARLKARETECARMDAWLAQFYREHPDQGLVASLLSFLSRLAHGVEVSLFFWLIGHPISWFPAVSLDSLAVLFAALSFMIPVAAGVQDGGTILLSLGFNLGETLGATFTIVGRLREAFWLSPALLVVARENARTVCPEGS